MAVEKSNRLGTTEDLVREYPWTKPSTWAYFAWAGTGPTYFKRGRRRLYDLDEVAEWMRSNRQASTSDVGESNA